MTEDSRFFDDELFGFRWLHVATIVETNISLDEEGLLTAVRAHKFHEVTFNAGSTLTILFSPEGEAYFRMGRDVNRVNDQPSIPNLWRLVEYTTPEKQVIRTDNEDSLQGPVPELEAAY
jgi:hypothetical protein